MTLVQLDSATIDAIVERTAARANELVLGNLIELQAEARTERSHSVATPPSAHHRGDRAPSEPQLRLVDAQTLASALGCSRDCIYAHSAELGGQRIGSGPRGRLRFDFDRALEAWTSRCDSKGSQTREPPAPQRGSSPRRRQRLGSSPELLPIRGAVAPTNASREGK